MIRQMAPSLLPDRYVFAGPEAAAAADRAIATVREAEGLSLILPVEVAAEFGAPSGPIMRQITLNVTSALDGIGLTGAVADALTREGIACNVVAGLNHDHVFVPEEDADRALSALEALSRDAGEPTAIRPATEADNAEIAAILMPVFRAGDTYTVDPDISEADALAYWTGGERKVFVAERDGRVLGTYYLVRNQKGGGSHVANAGFATHSDARGKGLARAMLAHAEDAARQTGFRAMQFNFVVASNTRAVTTWERAGYVTAGRLPEAFRHPEHGYVDALVMMKRL